MTDEIRRAAKGVALVWRDDRRDGNDQAITEELRSNLDRLVTAFERRAGGHLEDLAIHRAAEYLEVAALRAELARLGSAIRASGCSADVQRALDALPAADARG